MTGTIEFSAGMALGLVICGLATGMTSLFFAAAVLTGSGIILWAINRSIDSDREYEDEEADFEDIADGDWREAL